MVMQVGLAHGMHSHLAHAKACLGAGDAQSQVRWGAGLRADAAVCCCRRCGRSACLSPHLLHVPWMTAG